MHLSANWPSNVLRCYVYMDRLSRESRKTTTLLILHMYGETLYDVAQQRQILLIDYLYNGMLSHYVGKSEFHTRGYIMLYIPMICLRDNFYRTHPYFFGMIMGFLQFFCEINTYDRSQNLGPTRPQFLVPFLSIL